MTNEQKIKNLSTEELAAFLLPGDCEDCSFFGKECNGNQCKEEMVEWLKQEAEECS